MTQNYPIEKQVFTWQDGMKIVLAVMTFGIGWFAENQTTVIAYAAIILVWLFGVVAKQSERFAWLRGKGPLTVLIFIVAFVISYLFQPFALPAFPSWTGDAGTFVPLFSAWISGTFSIVGSAVVFAMSVYNILLARLLEKMPDLIGQFFE